ncbi:FAD-dependent oxidoreductase [cf. Phormidesmis sp. LEGE 11477]|uniref:flavin monoamine oxidase family protein n=1 Tax=cf. Phormidesmis sp. LEGE 11477 TaxID=1828680 RepID=UPI00187F9F33|nr:FAD-dependent oxidoreductase [cf. Phormidesmis sp. LEGE 11477]MBE9062462.1 FAD-dependent oxidoreductase [cf. Phormidesmis sp. LEGE 11477]
MNQDSRTSFNFNAIPPISRRWLLRSAAALGSAAFTSRFIHTKELLQAKAFGTGIKSTNLLNELDAMPNPSQPLKVVILGAGMAGLCAAYELEKHGHSCVILEAERSHVGGRVRTLRFGDSLYGEVGASQIAKSHDLTHHYVNECELQLRSSVTGNPDAYYYLRGQRIRAKNSEYLSSLYNLTDSEQGLTPNDVLGSVIGSRLSQLSEQEKAEIFAQQIQSPAVRELDKQSMLQWCKASGFSDSAIEMMAAANGFLGGLMHFSALSFVRVGENYGEMEEIVGGSDRLPAALADKLTLKPRMGCEVIGLERDDAISQAAAVYVEGDSIKREVGDFVLCTIPFPVLSGLDNPFSAAKRQAIRELSYVSATKVLALANRRFWELEDGIYGGSTSSDLPISTVRYPSDNAQAKDSTVSAKPSILLASYTTGSLARQLAHLPELERHRIVQQNLAKIHPQVDRDGAIQSMKSWSWDNHRWSLGAWSLIKPYQQLSLYEHVIAPEGRIYFAGEHTSTNQGWMQSALESSLSAVKAMLKEAYQP